MGGNTDYRIRHATAADAGAVRRIVGTVLDEHGVGGVDLDGDLGDDRFPYNYESTGGTYWVVESRDADLVGCAGLARLDAETMELRRMYLLSQVRGLGLGRRMLTDLIRYARGAGVCRMIIETATPFEQAIQLYRSQGFVRVARPGCSEVCDQVWELPLCAPAAIFEMDGVLVESAMFWKEAEREAFGAVGVDVSKQGQQVTATMTTADVARYWYERQPWKDEPLEALERRVVGGVIARVQQSAECSPGVVELLGMCRAKGMKIGLASNAPRKLCHVTLEALQIKEYFDSIVSADDVLRGKPSPDIHLLAAVRLGVSPRDCLVFEGSSTGVHAAKSAGMAVVMVRPRSDTDSSSHDDANLAIGSLDQLTQETLDALVRSHR